MIEITNDDDTIDSRDIASRIQELETFIDSEDEKKELIVLKAMEAEFDTEEWEMGVTLVRESHFTEYVTEWCDDTGILPNDFPMYIEDNIDRDGIASDARQDCLEVEFDGVTYIESP